MKTELTETEIREIETQLSCPNGDFGIEVGKTMNISNIDMTLNTIKTLGIQQHNVVLELGHGNCGHLKNVLETAKDISYYGLEISETMHKEAQTINQQFFSSNNLDFKLYDGETIPFQDNHFDRIMSVNTVYFWSNPKKLINEIERCLKPNGICILTFAQKEFMKKLPFVGKKFTLFNKEDMQQLVALSNLEVVKFIGKTDMVISKANETVKREYLMALLTKK